MSGDVSLQAGLIEALRADGLVLVGFDVTLDPAAPVVPQLEGFDVLAGAGGVVQRVVLVVRAVDIFPPGLDQLVPLHGESDAGAGVPALLVENHVVGLPCVREGFAVERPELCVGALAC